MKVRLLLLLAVATFVAVGSEAVSSRKVRQDSEEKISSATLRLRNRLFGKRKHRTICSADNDQNNAKKLREAVKGSDFVFTGTVVGVPSKNPASPRRMKLRKKKKKKTSHQESNQIPASSPEDALPVPQTFLVEVKRVIKSSATDILTAGTRLTLRVPSEFVSGVQLTSDPLLNTNCVEFHPVLKILQTTILLARRDNGSAAFQLTSYPIAMTLRHLERVDAAVQGLGFWIAEEVTITGSFFKFLVYVPRMVA